MERSHGVKEVFPKLYMYFDRCCLTPCHKVISVYHSSLQIPHCPFDDRWILPYVGKKEKKKKDKYPPIYLPLQLKKAKKKKKKPKQGIPNVAAACCKPCLLC